MPARKGIAHDQCTDWRREGDKGKGERGVGGGGVEGGCIRKCIVDVCILIDTLEVRS